MSKVLLSFTLLLALHVAGQPAASLRPFLDSALFIMQEQALHRKDTDWKAIRTKIYRETKGIDNIDSLLQRFPLLFEWLQDFHGSIQSDQQRYSWTAGKPVARSNPALDSAIRKAPGLLARRWNDVGYFRIPGGSTKNIPFVIQMLADSLCKIDPATVKGWIIDLRLNRGGNIWFMLPPLAGVLGDGVIGGYRYTDGRPDSKILIEGGKVRGNGQWYEVTDAKCQQPQAHLPVVVLVGPETASSAEGVMLAFKGRPNTLILGEPTAGFVTSNNTFTLRPGITLVLATAYMQDRKGNAYTTALQPDKVITGGDNFFNLEHDQKIIAAKTWIAQQVDQ